MKAKVKIFFIGLFLAAFKGALIEFIPDLKHFDSYLLLGIDIIIAYLGISSIAFVHKRYSFILSILLLVSTFNYFFGNTSLFNHVNGLREIVNVFFVIIFFQFVVKSNCLHYVNRFFRKFATIFLVLQIPISVFQFSHHTYEAGDWVYGTLGEGGSGILTFSIFILVYYLIENNLHGESPIAKSKYLLSHSYYFIPCLINETKITFLLIPLLFLTFVDFRKIKSSLLGLSVSFLVVMVFSNYYTNQGTVYSDPISSIFNQDFLENYLGGDVESYDDVPRITKIILGSNILGENGHLILGQEYSAFKGGTSVALTPFAERYQWLLLGSRPYIFYLLITGGVSLILLILLLFISEIRRKPFNRFSNSSNGLLLFLSSVFLIIMFYNDSFRNPLFLSLYCYTLIFSKYYKINEKETSYFQ